MNADRARRGGNAVRAGTPDYDSSDPHTSAVDAIANIMHWLKSEGGDPTRVLESARLHFQAEQR